MSASESISPGATLGSFKLVERLGTTTWRAEDGRSGKTVALKILANRLPADAARRETAIRDVRLAAVLQHLNVVVIDEVTAAGEALVMVMPFLEATPLSTVATSAASREAFFRIAWQLNAAMKFLHDKGIVHGNITGDSVLVTPAGEVKLAGMNLSNLLPRREGAPRSLPDDVRKVAYLAPEQITNQLLDHRADLFSAGVVFYQLATGRLPYQEAQPAELARKIVSDPPASPKAANPAIEAPVMNVLGRCLFKDPSKRYRDARMVADDITRIEPGVEKWAEDLGRRIAAESRASVATQQASAQARDAREAILFMADIANYDDLLERDPDGAARAVAKMQQILGESVYLFDGRVIDPFASRMVAELPTVEAALEAARKGEFDLVPDHVPGSDMLHVRLLLHAGWVTVSSSSIVGEAVDRAVHVIEQIQPLQLFITEDFVKRGRSNVRLRDAAARGGVKLFTIVAPERELEPSAASDSDLPVAQEVPTLAGAVPGPVPAAVVAPAATRPKSKAPLFALVGGLIAFAVGSALVWSRRGDAPPAQTTAAPVKASVAIARKVYIAPVTADPSLAPQAEAMRLSAVELLKRMPGVEVATSPGADAIVVTSELRAGATGTELAFSGSGAATPVPAIDAASGIRALIEFAGAQLSSRPAMPAAPAVLNAFSDAVTARAANDNAKTETSLRAVVAADPAYLPAQLYALEFFSGSGNQKDALDAARNVFAADPANVDAARRVARASLGAGEIQQALRGYSAVLKKTSADPEALNVIAQYALASGDANLFASALKRLKAVPQGAVAVHEPDALIAAGRIDAAISKYYDIEVLQPTNSALALKIGRVSILRRSMAIAELELKKLEQLDPIYALPLLRAYIAAEKQDRAGARKALDEAERAAQPSDPYWTAAAEVHAIFADTRGVLDSLEQAVARKEPTGSYILANPLFRYLKNDERFMRMEKDLRAQQEEFRVALAQIGL